MAVVNQYSQYTSVPSAVLDLFLSKLSLLDEYIIMCTGSNEYQMLVLHVNRSVDLYTVERPGSTYNNYWRLSHSSASEFTYSVSNEYYVYSNVGVGTAGHLPCYDMVTAVSCQVLVVFLVFWVLFRSIFFRRVEKRR